MLLTIDDLLSGDEVAALRDLLDRSEWASGALTAGSQATVVKNNQQVPEGAPTLPELRQRVLAALERNPLFLSAALPLKVFPPLFNRYQGGQSFGAHVDNAVRPVPGTAQRVRTDLSATLFLNAPEDYDGGELVIDDVYGAHSVKLPAGSMVLYPAGSLHNVRPVTRGARLASFFWIQSMVRDEGARTLLFDLDSAIRQVAQATPDESAVVQLTGVYHNLLRRWGSA
jgi:PKHD-type hydroxylase